jgi:hypothetical protein
MSSPSGPALQLAGGSLLKLASSLVMRFADAIYILYKYFLLLLCSFKLKYKKKVFAFLSS